MAGLLRTLLFYKRTHLAVALGAAVATAVLAGALVVGDSVRGSLRDLTLERLGAIDSALVLDRFVDSRLAERLAEHDPAVERAVPAILLRGSAVHDESGRRASKISIHGVAEDFFALYDREMPPFDRAEGQLYPSVWLNGALARELGVAVGDALVLRYGEFSAIPRDTLMGEKETDDVVGRGRFSVRGIAADDSGWGSFGLVPSQQEVFNAFVERRQLQRMQGRPRQANALYVSTDSLEHEPELAEVVSFEDVGLRLDVYDDYLQLESDAFVLSDDLASQVTSIANELKLPTLPVQAYIVNAIRHDGRMTPYSMIAALDPIPDSGWGSVELVAGRAIANDGEILLNRWAADDLQAGPGDSVTIDYFIVGPREEMTERSRELTVVGVVAMEALGADRALTPEYPGIQDAGDMSDWDPPFPVDLDRVRDEDEAYWDDWGAAPKGFISAATGRELWSSRWGTTTAVRFGGGEAEAERLRTALLGRVSPEQFGLVFQPIKAQGLEAAVGATDFGQLFLAFSFFLILAAAMLVSLLFGLGVEQRAGEIGLLLATGWRAGRVQRRLLAEGAILAALGGLIGIVGGVGYAAAMMAALRTIWRGAVGSSRLFLHVEPLSLAIGWVAALFVVILTVLLTLRRLRRAAPSALLKGNLTEGASRGRGLVSAIAQWGGLLGGVALVALAWLADAESSPGLAMGAAFLLLIAGIAAFARWCRGGRERGSERLPSPLVGMAARNSAWNPGRSILSVALVASASFLIVLVGSMRGDLGDSVERRDSGTGGFALVAESDVEIFKELDRPAERLELGLDDEALFAETTTVAMRLLPGDDASCLNLYRPEKPRVLGVPDVLVERAAFGFKSHAALPDGETNPWTLLQATHDDGTIPAVLDFNSAQWILKVKLGQILSVEDETGERLGLRVVGLLDTSIFQSEVLIGEAAFLEHFPSQAGYRYFLVDAPQGKREELETALEATLAPYGFDATTTREKLEAFKVVEHTYLSTFQLLGGLGMLLGTIGLAVVMVRNVIERRKELATLRAFGYRRGRVALMVLAENVVLLVAGIAVGAFAALVSVAPRLAQTHVPWGSLALTLVAILAVGMLAAVVAVRGTLRMELVPSLKADR